MTILRETFAPKRRQVIPPADLIPHDEVLLNRSLHEDLVFVMRYQESSKAPRFSMYPSTSTITCSLSFCPRWSSLMAAFPLSGADCVTAQFPASADRRLAVRLSLAHPMGSRWRPKSQKPSQSPRGTRRLASLDRRYSSAMRCRAGLGFVEESRSVRTKGCRTQI